MMVFMVGGFSGYVWCFMEMQGENLYSFIPGCFFGQVLKNRSANTHWPTLTITIEHGVIILCLAYFMLH
jgi:hypothetical protein